MVANIGAVITVLRLRILEFAVQHNVSGPRRFATDDAVLRRDDLVNAAVLGTSSLELSGLDLRRGRTGGFGGAVDSAPRWRETDAEDAAVGLRLAFANADLAVNRSHDLKMSEGYWLVGRDQRLLSRSVRTDA